MIDNYHLLILGEENAYRLRRELLKEFLLYLEGMPGPLEIFLSAVERDMEEGATFEVSRYIATFLKTIIETYRPTDRGWQLVEQGAGLPLQMAVTLPDGEVEALDCPMWLTELYTGHGNERLAPSEFSTLMWRKFVEMKHLSRERKSK